MASSHPQKTQRSVCEATLSARPPSPGQQGASLSLPLLHRQSLLPKHPLTTSDTSALSPLQSPLKHCLSDLAQTDHLNFVRVNCRQGWQEFHLKALGEAPPWKHLHSWSILHIPSCPQVAVRPVPALSGCALTAPSCLPFLASASAQGSQGKWGQWPRPLSSGPAALCPRLHRMTPEFKLTPHG